MQKTHPPPPASAASSIFSTFSSFIKTDQSAAQPRNVTPLPNMTSTGNSGDFFIRMSLDLLQNSKEMRRNEPLKNAIAAALEALDHPETSNPLAVFKPFQMVCHSGNPELITIAIDCLGKLFTYNYWKFAAGVHVEIKPHDTATGEEEADGDNDGTSEMITFVINTICDSFIGENTDDKVQLQIIKALQAALSNADPTFSLHGAILLKAVRTTYNIFLLSKSNDVQTIAQGTVIQMVQNVLGRIPVNKKADSPPLEGNFDREFKDAFKVFRTLCVLSIKAIPASEGTIELRSQPIRSKLLALHLLSSIVNSHAPIFFMSAKSLWPLAKDPVTSPETFKFMDSVKEFLILSLTRNSTSIVLPVFEVSMGLFGRLWTNLRPLLKKEMSVFFTEIVIPILEGRKNIQWYQRHCLLKSLSKIFLNPANDAGQMLVEIYLNYDCDAEATAKENIWERMMNALSKVTSQHVDSATNSVQPLIQCFVNQGHGTPALTTSNLVSLSKEQVKELFAVSGDAEELRKQAVLFMCTGVLKNLQEWCEKRASIKEEEHRPLADTTKGKAEDDTNKTIVLVDENAVPSSAPPRDDDPAAIRNLKQKKEHLIEGIKRFNTKPKKGIQHFLETGCIESRSPKAISSFLLSTEGLSKTMIGDFLGEGEEENIAIMHSFVEQFEFSQKGFVGALRDFLQSFRLPGEAQKIDRFMLKFAEIYLKGNPTTFSSADTAYVLAYSTIMLNTDQHNSQVKKKMTKPDFIKNNRGIDGGKDLPEELLAKVYEEIAINEIIMKDELPAKINQYYNKANSLESKNSLAQRSENMALKTEQLMRSKAQHSTFISASHYAHVKPMFERIWMSLLTGMSTPLQESEDAETVMACLDGIKHSVRISCIFDMELEKNAFLSTLGKFTLLNNIHEMREKNIEAIRTLLDISYQEGGNLGSSWKNIVVCISQLEKLQLVGDKLNDAKAPEKRKDGQKGFIEEAAAVASSQMMTLAVDKIFTSSSKLSGTAIVHFVKALCEVSFDEISNSQNQEQPRMYCLQRLVEISYYNMNRIRVEWSNIWAILGNHFNQVGCYPNTNVALFALDKLRQLTMKFLELEELPNFKFQKDFLRPFEEIVKNNPDPKIKDMCLVCLQQIIQVKGNSIKSGWKTLCGSLIRVAREVNEPILNLGFDITKAILKNNFDHVTANSSLHDFIACLVEFCRNRKVAKISLQSVDLFKQCTQKITDSPAVKIIFQTQVSSPSMDCTQQTANDIVKKSSVPAEDDIYIRLWMPVLFGLHDVIMTCDLEVRTKALSYLFDTLRSQGQSFSVRFWDMLSKGVLFPIFDDMKQSSNNTNSLNSKFSNKEELSIWLSTTLIQALRQFVDLFTLFYQKLGFMLPNMFELMKCCLLHENEALSRIGSTCIQQLVEHNAHHFDEKSWDQLANLFVELNDETMPTFLFFTYKEGDLSAQFPFLKKPLASLQEKKEFQKQISKCVMHLMVIQTLQDVILTGPNDMIYKIIPNKELLRLVEIFQSSYELAHVFNETMDLRQALHKLGYMKQLPNLLKQETMSVNAYLTIIIKIFSDSSPQRIELRGPAQARLIPLCLDIIKQYNSFDNEARQRNLTVWRPVILNILSAFSKFDDENFKLHIQKFYSPAIKLLLQEISAEVKQAIFDILSRTGKIFGLIDLNDSSDLDH